jgi:NAD+ kinase
LLTLAADGAITPPGAVALPAEELLSGADLIIAAGGDATVLFALHLIAASSVPLLGVNLGHLGFLAEIDVPELPDSLAAIGSGGFSIEEWAPLEVDVDGERCPDGPMRAFNDIVLSRSPGAGQAALAVTINGDVFARYTGDAVIVSTSAGSTAYSFSAGGPILFPGVSALVITPVAPHGNFRTPLVIAPTDELRLDVLAGSAPVRLELDGRVVGYLERPSSVAIRLSNRAARVVRLDRESFVRRARRKLQVGDPLELGSDRLDGAASRTGPLWPDSWRANSDLDLIEVNRQQEGKR